MAPVPIPPHAGIRVVRGLQGAGIHPADNDVDPEWRAMDLAQIAVDAAEQSMILRYLQLCEARSSRTMAVACRYCGAAQTVQVQPGMHWVALVCSRCGTFIRELPTSRT
jgi:ribosomal protein S27E